MAASALFEDVFKELTRTGTEEQQDSSDEESDKKDEAIESAVNYFTECSDLGENFALVKQGENRYLRGLYEQQARGKDYYFSILCEYHSKQEQSQNTRPLQGLT